MNNINEFLCSFIIMHHSDLYPNYKNVIFECDFKQKIQVHNRNFSCLYVGKFHTYKKCLSSSRRFDHKEKNDSISVKFA